MTISKIRFLEAEGLVAPERLPSGYRRFLDGDVERLRYVLTAQRDRFWPLKVIREALDALDRGLSPATDAEAGAVPVVPELDDDPDLPDVAELLDRPTLRLTGPELREAAGLDRPTFESLVTFGLLRPVTGERGDHYDTAALAVGRAAAALAAVGIEARHLRPFRTAADREIALVEQVSRPGDEEATAEILRQCLALHTALVKAGRRT